MTNYIWNTDQNRRQNRKSKKGKAAAAAALALAIALAGCGTAATASTASSASTAADSTAASATTESTSTSSGEATSASATSSEREQISDNTDGGHAIEADGEEASYTAVDVTKSGDADGDEADFYGENAAVFATNGATLDLSDITVTSDGTHANAVFSYGEGTTVNISDSTLETSGDCSGGLMTTGGGTMNATDLTVHTTGRSSAAIRSDRGGGTVNVTGGSYTSEGVGSPAIYSTADITVSDAELTSTAAQGVVVEGKNSVALKNVTLTADNSQKNGDKSDTYQAVMIYQSMSGDAAEGAASFSMDGGSLVNKNGDIFFVNNTVATIDLKNASITNEDADGIFLRAEAAGWGTEGSNGGQVTLNAENQKIEGDMVVDAVSALNLYLKSGSSYTGAINVDGAAGDVYVELADDATWTLTGDSYITSLTCDADAIDLNGHTLYVNGEAYEAGTASEGTAIEIKATSSGSGEMSAPPEGADGEMSPPDGQSGQMGTPPEGTDGERPTPPDGGQGGTPPEKPAGDKPSGTPPAKPGSEQTS